MVHKMKRVVFSRPKINVEFGDTRSLLLSIFAIAMNLFKIFKLYRVKFMVTPCPCLPYNTYMHKACLLVIPKFYFKRRKYV